MATLVKSEAIKIAQMHVASDIISTIGPTTGTNEEIIRERVRLYYIALAELIFQEPPEMELGPRVPPVPPGDD